MADEAMEGERSCATPGCGKAASLQCPTCLKLGITNTFFCSQVSYVLAGVSWAGLPLPPSMQDCFKGYWSQHKAVHKRKDGGNWFVHSRSCSYFHPLLLLPQ